MIGVFCFSEDPAFQGIADRIHLFSNEQEALDWQIQTLIERGFIRHEDGKWIVNECELPYEPETDKLGALSAFQDSCDGLEFFHEYAVQDHRKKGGAE